MRPSPLDPAARREVLRRRPSQPSPGGGTFAGHLRITDPAETGPAAPADPAAALLALLDTHEISEEVAGQARRRRAALNRSDALLQRLEGLRTGLLDGRIAPERLQALAEALRAERMASDHQGIEAVLGEIELRVAVELAKLADRSA